MEIQSAAQTDAFYAGLEGLRAGSERMQNASGQLAQSNRQAIDINQSAINLLSAERQTQASIEVIKRADGMIGTIIDTFA